MTHCGLCVKYIVCMDTAILGQQKAGCVVTGEGQHVEPAPYNASDNCPSFQPTHPDEYSVIPATVVTAQLQYKPTPAASSLVLVGAT
jgi:hypothetical protein